MAILNPSHLLDQAEKLIAAPQAGPPRQVDIRRAISAAYYSVFHATLAAAADQCVGAVHRGVGQYALAYRSIDHQKVKDVCAKVKLPSIPRELSAYSPPDGFDSDTRDFASVLHELQQKSTMQTITRRFACERPTRGWPLGPHDMRCTDCKLQIPQVARPSSVFCCSGSDEFR